MSSRPFADRVVAEALQQPVWTARPDGTVDYVNPFWSAYTGVPFEPALGKGWCAVVHPDDIAVIEAHFRAASAAKEPYEVEYRLRRADGVYRWHLARVAPIYDERGTIVQWAGTAIDVDDRRRAEEESARLAAIVEGSWEAIVGRTLDGTVTSWNPGAERLYGYPSEEIVGRDVTLLIPPGYEDELARIRARLVAGESIPAFETVRLRQDGTRVDVTITLSPIRDRAGRVIGASSVARDLSERVTARSERRERERQAELVAAVGLALTAPLGLADQLRRCAEALVTHLDVAFARVWTLDADDPNLLVLRASAGLYTHLDGPHGRIPVGAWKIGRIAAERRPHLTNDVPADPEVSDHAWARREGMVAFAGYPLLVGERLIGVMGAFARAPLSEATFGTLGSVADAIAVGVDRAETEIAREMLLVREQVARAHAQAAEARYRGLFAGVADAILVADAERHYVDANAAAVDLLGYPRDELLTLRVDDVVEGGPDWTATEYARFRAEGRWQGELELRRKDGTTVPVEARATVVELPDGPVNLSVVRDVSERRRTQVQQQEFLEAVSHDLKNPLAVVRVQAQLVGRRARKGVVDPVVTAEAMATVVDAADRLEQQLEELQDVARLRSGNPLELRTEPVDLVALARDAAVVAQAATDCHQVRVVATEPAIVGHWDPLRLRRVLDNLLGNAIKYSPGGGVTVEVKRERRDGTDWGRLSVRDEGVGIPDTDLAHVFERYRRGSNVGTRTRGTGIGLAGVRQIVAQHGGTVSVASKEGSGSVFTVCLPIQFATDEAAP